MFPIRKSAKAFPVADHAFILPGLIAHTGNKGDELREIAPVELELRQFLPSDRSAEFRRFGVYLGQPLAVNNDFLDVSDKKSDIDTRVLRDAQDDTFGDVGTESFGRNRDVVASGRQGSRDIFACGIGGELADLTGRGAHNANTDAGDNRPSIVANCAGQGSCILGPYEGTQEERIRTARTRERPCRLGFCICPPCFQV